MEASTITGSETLALRVDRVAELLDCSKSKVYALIQNGHLQAIKLSEGSKAGVRVLSSSLEEFLLGEGVVAEKQLTPAEKVAAQQHRYRRSSRTWF